VRVVRFNHLRHTFARRLASSGQPIRAIQEFLGQADINTTQIYAHYASTAREVDMVNQALRPTRPSYLAGPRLMRPITPNTFRPEPARTTTDPD
jgi:hypothetical protein